MNEIFNYPWILFAAFAFFIAMLILREVVIMWHLPSGHPERGISFFNACVLSATFCVAVAGGHFLSTHVRTLERIIPSYPLGRYAPEREALSSDVFDKNWIFVSEDPPHTIMSFYQAHASEDTYSLVQNESTTATRLMFTTHGKNVFLTMVEEGKKTILYYSIDGEIKLLETH